MSENSVEFKRLARRLARIEQAQANMSKPQLAYSSIENGNVKSYEGGDLKMIVGLQDDGGQTTAVFNGPTPPTPVGFTVDVDHGCFILHWQGDFDGDALAPSDWSRAEVHASQDPFFVPSRATARGSIVSAAGGEVTIGVLKGPWTVKMVAWSQAGKMSVPSAPVDVEVPGYGDIVLEEIDAATTLIKNAGEMLLEGRQTLADKLAGIADLDPEEISDEIAQARQEAIDAALAEIANVEGTLTSAIGGKSSTKWSTSNPPANYDGAVGDTWVKLTSLGSGGREIRRSRWQGDVWVDHPVDGAVLSNVDASTITTGFLDVVNRIRAGAILADKLLIGGARNLIPNGDLSQGNASLWPSPTNGNGPTYSATDKPEGFQGSVSYHSTGTISPTDFGRWSVNGMTDLVFEVWAKADKPDSRIYVEVRDQNGALLGSASRTAFGAEGGWKGAPAAASYSYPVASYAVPTTWTKLRSTIKVPPETTEVYVARVYFNHSSGTERDATISLSGMRLSPMVDGTLITPGGIQTPHLAADVLEVGNLKAGTAALAEAVIKKLFTEVVVAQMVQAEEFIGENAILTGAVTAPKITASEELWAKLAQFVTVYAEMVDSDVFNGRVFRGSTFLTTNDSRWSDAGLFLNDNEGNPRIQAPTDGSDFTVNAEVVAKSLTATGRASFLAKDNRIEPGAGLVLTAGVGDPPSPPVVSTYYPTIKAPLEDTDRGAYGLAWADEHFWRWVENDNTTGSRGRLEKVSTGGSVVAAFDTGDFLARNGAVGIGSELFLLGPKTGSNDRRWVQVYGTDGAYKRQWVYSEYGSGTYQPGIGRDEDGNLLIAQCGGTGYYRHRVFNKTTGALVSVFDGPSRTNSGISGLYVGAADLGAKRIVLSKNVNSISMIPVFSYPAGADVLNDFWTTPGGAEPRGLAWADGKFYSLAEDGTITEYGTRNNGDNTNNWWSAYRWAKDVDEDLTIDLSSRISPPARFSWPRRARLRVSAPNLPQGAGEIAPSLAYKTTMPTRTDFHSPTWWSATGETSAYYYTLPADWASASTPTDGNTFPDGEPSVLSAASGLFEVKGDGSGRWGPLVFNVDGTMSSAAVPAWIPITTFKPGFGPQSWGDVPGYRIWPDGKVEWRGVIAGTMTAGGGRPVLNIPGEARPGRPKNKTGTSNSSTSNIRVEFGPTSAPAELHVYPYGENRAWVSIDELFYYLT